MANEMNQMMLQLILIGVLISAAIFDMRGSRIPNWLTLSASLCGLLGHVFIDGLDGMFFSLKGLLLGTGLFMVIHLIGGMGAGDVKLMGAVGALLGPTELLAAALITALLGGVWAVAVIVSHWGAGGAWNWITGRIVMVGITGRLPDGMAGGQGLALRYAPVIAVGTLLSQLIWP